MLLDMTFRIQDPAWECACEALNQTDDASCTPLSDMLHIAINECSILWGPGARYVPSCHMCGTYLLGHKHALDEHLPRFMLPASQQARIAVILWGALQHALGCPRPNRMISIGRCEPAYYSG